MTDDEIRFDAQDEYRAERYRELLMWAHPDCRDPLHPGCEHCSEDAE